MKRDIKLLFVETYIPKLELISMRDRHSMEWPRINRIVLLTYDIYFFLYFFRIIKLCVRNCKQYGHMYDVLRVIFFPPRTLFKQPDGYF